MARKYAATYTSLQSYKPPSPERDSSSADGSRDPSPRRASRPSYQYSPAIPFPQPRFEVKHFRRGDYGAPRSYQPLSPGSPARPRASWSVPGLLADFVSGHSPWTYASFRAITATLQLSLLVYLQLTYLQLPRTNTGELPRISNIYATYPFVSCIGSLHLTTYRTFTVLIVILSLVTDTLLFLRSRGSPIAYWHRRVNLLASLAAYCLSLWLSYAAAKVSTQTHLVVIGVHSVAVLAVKTSSLATDHAQREAWPALRRDAVARTIRWWKEATVWFALPVAVLLNTGTYACRGDELAAARQIPGTACYRVLAIAAPADWLYALITANWSLHMAYEISRDMHVSMVMARSDAMAMDLGGYRDRKVDDDARYEALVDEGALRSTLWDAEHPDIDLEDIPAAVVKEEV